MNIFSLFKRASELGLKIETDGTQIQVSGESSPEVLALIELLRSNKDAVIRVLNMRDTTPIKPIETRWKGYRFRSRLEARWGVCFEALGVRWEYEAEGYDLGRYGWYLPDFWLPDIAFHAEAKPDHELLSVEETLRFRYFDNYPPAGSLGLIMLFGTPDTAQNPVRAVCQRHGICDESLIARAVDAARSARFEHGEKP